LVLVLLIAHACETEILKKKEESAGEYIKLETQPKSKEPICTAIPRSKAQRLRILGDEQEG
jgi:hypothetical protein